MEIEFKDSRDTLSLEFDADAWINEDEEASFDLEDQLIQEGCSCQNGCNYCLMLSY